MNKESVICNGCTHCTSIGEGDHICMKSNVPKIVLMEYKPTKEFMWCRGRFYEEN